MTNEGKAAIGVGVALLLVLPPAIWWGIGQRDEAEAKVAADIASSRALLDAIPVPAPVDMSPSYLRRANAAWAEWDALRGDQFRTPSMLKAHLLKANDGIELLSEPDQKALAAHNQAQYEKRAKEFTR
jgi:hypothetical protein